MTTRPLRSRLAPIAAAALLLLAIPTTWALADTDESSTVSARQQVIHLDWTLVDAREDDIPPEGTSSGDTFQAVFELTGKIRGSADFACTSVGKSDLCDGIIRLPAGDIYVSTGPTDQADPAPILGGTQAYQGIRGQFTKTANPDGTGTYTLTFTK